MTLARKTDMRPVRVNTRCDKAMEHILIWRWAKRSLCHSLMIGSIKRGDEVVGSETRVKVVKNKVAPPFQQAEFDILYNEGISLEGEIIDLGVARQIVEKSGAWYAYNGERIGQGKDNAREFLRTHPDLAHEIENRIRVSFNLPDRPAVHAPE